MFEFNIRKTVQAAAVLLRLSPNHRMSRVRLLKLLYLADRAVLAEKGHSITGDHVVAMKNGPVLSRTYDCIKSEDTQAPTWQRSIATEGPINVRLIRNVGNGHLSPYEIATLERTSREHEGQDDWELADYTHGLPEYRKNAVTASSKNIPPEDVLDAIGLGGKAEEMRAENKAHAFAAKLFGGTPAHGRA